MHVEVPRMNADEGKCAGIEIEIEIGIDPFSFTSNTECDPDPEFLIWFL
jgi:hypothetical protein